MIIDNFHRRWSYFCPNETDAVLFIDADAVLSSPIPEERFKTIAWWHSQLFQGGHRIKLIQFTASNVPQ